MKKLIIVFVSLFFITAIIAQNDSIQPPYKRFPFFPPVKLLLPDSVSYFTKADLKKKSPALLMLFNPQCEHCQHETEELIKNIDKFENIQVVMVTSMLFDSMMTFRQKYKLAQYKNIVVARDANFFLFSFYLNHSLPLLAFYDKKKELIKIFEGSMKMEDVIEVFK